MTSASEFDGKVVLITGGAQGQGLAEARLLTDRGASIVVADIDGKRGQDAVAELAGHHLFVELDVSRGGSWESAISDIKNEFGRLDVLVNNAGIYVPRTLQETDEDLWDRTIAINQRGVYLGMRHCAEMLEATSGCIVNVSSAAGLRGMSGNFAYGATKWAVRGMSLSAALELAPRGIRVNVLFPGVIETDMLSANDPAKLEAMRRSIPIGRTGLPEDVAELVVFLCSDRSSYITGAEIKIDGGRGI